MKAKFFNIIVIFLMSLSISIKGYSQTQVSGPVSGTWIRANSPYIAVGNISVEYGDTLIIEPGIHVLFDGYYSLKVNGHLQAEGTESDSILFTHNHPDSFWTGIDLIGEGNNSILQYCRIEYSNQSGIDISGSSAVVKNCHLLHNTDIGSGPQSGAGGGINVNYADPLIAFNVIEYNSAGRGGGIHIYDNPESRPGVCRIFNNVIRHNTATWGGGIRVFSYMGCTPIIRNNVLDGNSVADSIYGGNIYIFPGAVPQIINNIIVNSPSGSGLLDLSNSIIRYNDVWNNKPYNYVNTAPGLGDISSDPLFVGGTQYDYHLQKNSPCIDTGDPEAPLDPDNSIADMGSFYYGIDQPPLSVTDLIARTGDRRVTLTWTNPNVIDYDHTKVVRNTFTFPQNPDDGVTIYKEVFGICQDTSLINGQTYYYGVFVYDEAEHVSSPSYVSAVPAVPTVSVIRVPWDYIKIQDALNSAYPGDTILVYPGHYSPSSNGESFPIVMADSVGLISKSGRDSTTIDAEQTNLVIMGANEATISGFTITNGFNSSISVSSGPTGGGILCDNLQNMRIVDNIITNNESNGEYLWDGAGGGIFCWNSSVEISQNEISYNIVGGDGGGIFCDASIFFEYSQYTISHNEIVYNKECGIHLHNVTAVISFNLIIGNSYTGLSSSPNPGGIYIQGFYNESDSYEIYNNTIALNTGDGIGCEVRTGEKAMTWNNIIGGNSSDDVHGVDAKYSLIADGYPGEGNINETPEFVGGTQFDYHLTENSPCIDAGDPNSPLDPDGTRADIGAYYFEHAGAADVELLTNQFVIYTNQGQDTSITLHVSNIGNWPLHYKLFDEMGNNREGAAEPDEYGYSWIDSDNPNGPRFEWVEIDSMGTEILTHENVDLPFPLRFYTNQYNSVEILYYGMLDFNFSPPFSEDNNPGNIPNIRSPDNFMAVFWDKFKRNSQPGSMYYFSDIEYNRFIVEYVDFQRSSSGAKETIQIIVNKCGSIFYQYKDVSIVNSATVGIEDATGQYGVQIAYNEDYLHDSLAVKIFTGASWLELPYSFSKIEAGSDEEITIQISSGALQPGNYDAKITLETNDPDESVVEIPVYLNVKSLGVDYTYDFAKQGWYLVSLPVVPADNSMNTLFPTALAAFNWETDHYIPVTELDTCGGYWLAIPGDASATVTGVPLKSYTRHYPMGWHMIGTVIDSVDFTNPNDQPDGSVLTHGYRYDTALEEYVSADTLIPGQGYWIAVMQECDLTIGETSPLAAKPIAQADKEAFYRQFGSQPPPPPAINWQTGEITNIPDDFALLQNYPNPFNALTTIKYQLPKGGNVTLQIYDILGRLVRSLVNTEQLAGYYELRWDGKDDRGQSVPSGLYFYRIQAGEFQGVKKLLLIK